MLLKVTLDKQIHIVKSTNVASMLALRNLIPQLFKNCPSRFYLSYLDEEGDQITMATDNDYKLLLSGSHKNVKVYIREKSEQFYDETQKFQIIDDENNSVKELIELQPTIQEQSEIKEESSDFKEMSQNLDESIQEKLRNMMPELINKIKTQLTQEIMNKSKFSQKPSEPTQSSQPKVVHRHVTCDHCGWQNIQGVRYKCSVMPNYDLCQKCQAIVDHPYPLLKIKHPRQAPLKIFTVINDDNEDSFSINGQRQSGGHFNDLIQRGFNIAQEFLGRHCPAASNASQEEPKSEQRRCPYMMKKQQEKEQKTEEPVKETKTQEVKPEPKIEVKEEVRVEPKIEVKTEAKPEPIVEKKQEVPVVSQQQTREDRMIQNANYLCQILDMSFTQAYRLAQNNPYLTKQQLLQQQLS